MTHPNTFAAVPYPASEAGQAVTGRSADVRKRPDPHNIESARPDPACAAVAGGSMTPPPVTMCCTGQAGRGKLIPAGAGAITNEARFSSWAVPDYGIERPEWRSSYHAGKEWYSDLRALIEMGCTDPGLRGGCRVQTGAGDNLHPQGYAQ